MKGRLHRSTDRRHHLRQLENGSLTPVMKHRMMYWSRIDESTKKRLNPYNLPFQQYTPTPDVVKDEIKRLLNGIPNATQPENLTIIVPRKKKHLFNFLDAYTGYNVKGKWHEWSEDNIALEIQFKDTPDEKVGNGLIMLVKLYNDLTVKEQVPMAFTTPLEETTFDETVRGRELADDQFPSLKDLVAGTKVELEHTDDKNEAKLIAKDHLFEDKDYYRKLKKAGL